MNIKTELESALAPMDIKVMKFSDFDQTAEGSLDDEDGDYGTCEGCTWEGVLNESGLCDTCEERIAEESMKELEYEYFSSRGVK